MNRRKKIWLTLALLCLISIGLASACYARFQLKPAPIPTGSNPKAIAIDEEGLALMQNMAKADVGGVVYAMYGTYEERFLDAYNSFHVKPSSPFTSQILIGNYDVTAHQFVIICLLDHSQVPCSSEAELAKFQTIDAFATTKVNVRLDGLTKQIHDFDVLAIGKPYAGLDQSDLSIRSTPFWIANLSNIYTEKSTIKANPAIMPFPIQNFSEMHFEDFFPSKLENPVHDNMAIEVWLDEQVKPSHFVDFYLHFLAQEEILGRFISYPLAVMAFIDYKQVPIYSNGQPHLPLYLERQPHTWQSLAVQVQAPHEMGNHELVILVRPYAYAALDGIDKYWMEPHMRMSQLIRLQVAQPSGQ